MENRGTSNPEWELPAPQAVETRKKMQRMRRIRCEAGERGGSGRKTRLFGDLRDFMNAFFVWTYDSTGPEEEMGAASTDTSWEKKEEGTR